MSRKHDDASSGAINAELDELASRCPNENQIFVDYLSIKGMAAVGAGGRCAEYAHYKVVRKAVKLARRDGYCSGRVPERDVASRLKWTCFYSPTYNNDWHDDILCSNAEAKERPYLREWDSFVTEAEIMEAARAYEANLNGG